MDFGELGGCLLASINLRRPWVRYILYIYNNSMMDYLLLCTIKLYSADNNDNNNNNNNNNNKNSRV